MKKRNFVLPIEVMDVYKDIQIMRNEEEARQFLESVIIYGTYGEEVYEPEELAQSILFAHDMINLYNMSKRKYKKKKKSGEI